MINLEEKILASIDLQKGAFGLNSGDLILQKVKKSWKPAIIIGSKKQDDSLQLWTAEIERNREIKYVCWGLIQRPMIKIVKNALVKESTLKNLLGSLKEFSNEASKIGIQNILLKARDVCVNL